MGEGKWHQARKSSLQPRPPKNGFRGGPLTLKILFVDSLLISTTLVNSWSQKSLIKTRFPHLKQLNVEIVGQSRINPRDIQRQMRDLLNLTCEMRGNLIIYTEIKTETNLKCY